MNSGILVSMRPIDGDRPAELVLQTDGERSTFELPPQLPLNIAPDFTIKYCTGWYDIQTHTGHPCRESATVDTKHEQCYACRKRTDFNPAFYNTTEISSKQAAYNDSPHSVYIAYFGDGLAKAGISADSRGLRRLREQGALLYAIVDSFPNADVAHYHEDALIQNGLRNSVNKRQKAKVLEKPIAINHESAILQSIIEPLGYPDLAIIDQLDDYFYGAYSDTGVAPFTANQLLSGTIRGIVGRYLVLENNQRHYGVWLNSLLGYQLTITADITPIEAPPQQASLF